MKYPEGKFSLSYLWRSTRARRKINSGVHIRALLFGGCGGLRFREEKSISVHRKVQLLCVVCKRWEKRIEYCPYSAYSTGPAKSRLSLPSARRGVMASSHACLVVDRSYRTSIVRPEGVEARGCGSGWVWKCSYPSPRGWSFVSPRLSGALCLVRVLRLMVAVVGDP